MNFFDIKKTIDTKRKLEWDHNTEKEYVPFMINRAFSMHQDNILYANEMNLNPFIPKKWQYDFYYGCITKNSRFDKWIKGDKTEADVQLISDYYHINNARALEFLSILSEDQVHIIKEKMNKGGKQ